MKFTDQELKMCYDFSKAMKDNHNPNIITDRDDWEIFRDDFRGKLGEVAVYNYIKANRDAGTTFEELDFTVTPRGQWDTSDIVINGKSYNVKSIKSKSNFLLVETLRYNNDGTYRYNNNDGQAVPVDGYILVKVTVEPDVQKNIFRQSFDDFCADGYDPKAKKGVQRTFSAEIVGGITHTDFWENKSFALKGIRCDYDNLNAIVQGEEPTSQVRPYDKKNNILQQDNYVIGRNNLISLEKLILE